jgi:hypothetical protein
VGVGDNVVNARAEHAGWYGVEDGLLHHGGISTTPAHLALEQDRPQYNSDHREDAVG